MVEPLKNSLEHANNTLQLTADIMKESFTRLAGSPEVKKAAEYLHKEYEKVSDTAKIEEFDLHRASFLNFLKWYPIMFIFAIICINLDWTFIYLALVFYLFFTALGYSQFLVYYRWFDKLYKKQKGYNVYGIIEPKNKDNVRDQVIISGHHDSPPVFNFLEKNPYFYPIHIALGLLPFFAFEFYYIYVAITKDLTGLTGWLIFSTLSIVLVGRLYFFESKQVSPGAGDNLIASCITVTMGKLFGKESGNRLPNTRLILLSTDAEESGLRGAFAYCEKHSEEDLKLPTKVITIDGIYRFQDLFILNRDINSFKKLSDPLAQEIAKCAKKFGIKIPVLPIPPIAGATDAGAFARAGYEVADIAAMEFKALRKETHYHTSHDIVDNIEPEAVEAILKILYEYLINL